MRNDILTNNVFNQIRECEKCDLCNIQKPLLDTFQHADVVWVGLSAVRVNDVRKSVPLAPDTRSGGLLKDIESILPDVSFYRTNLVKCLPELNGKIRYPNKKEMKACSPNLYNEISKISPKVVFLLGKKVAEHVFKEYNLGEIFLDKDFKYVVSKKNNAVYVPVHHPSFMLVYKRKFIDDYINNICELICRNIAKESKNIERSYYSRYENTNIQQELSF